jgi:hypothetical protein
MEEFSFGFADGRLIQPEFKRMSEMSAAKQEDDEEGRREKFH